eukprot:TRINITY_DN35372_c0_g1_i1.p1 TRINITY_DN35372_c0_g1~~TRINITY_DN35372_c0_g1_i1.p1  ORF type:complete len:936 (-),score=195.07 TRINITY_DN35372_c0_g1_i1:201-3008(-)
MDIETDNVELKNLKIVREDEDEDMDEDPNPPGRDMDEGYEPNDEEILEEDEELDEEELDNDDDEYALRFGGLDPLRFTEDDASGAQPYELLQKLEEETLARKTRKRPHQLRKSDETGEGNHLDLFGAEMDEIMEFAGMGRKGRSRKSGKRGRTKRTNHKLDAYLTMKLGEANLRYSMGETDKAIELLKEVIRLSPNVPDSYHTLGVIYLMLGDKKKAINFYMIAAHLTPKDAELWKRLATLSLEEGNTAQGIYCLTRAIRADPENVIIQWDRASLYVELKDYQKAAEAFDQILRLRPLDVEAHKMAAKMHYKNGECQHATSVLETFFTEHPLECDLTVVTLLASLLIEDKSYSKAIEQIEHARMIYCSGQGLPLELAVKAGISHAHIGNLEEAEKCFEDLNAEQAEEFSDLLSDVAEMYMSLGHYQLAIKYFSMLEGTTISESVAFWIKIGQCHQSLKNNQNAVMFYYKVLNENPDNIDVRLALGSLLAEDNNLDEAIQLLSAPEKADEFAGSQWWLNGRITKLLAQIYRSQDNDEAFVDTILPAIKDTLYHESLYHKVRNKKRLPKRVLLERVKSLADINGDSVFSKIRPRLPSSEMNKATRAKKKLAKMAALKEEQKAATLAAGLEWQSESEEESEEPARGEAPLPNLLKDDEHYQLLIEVCKALASLKRYWEALEIINQSLNLGCHMSHEKQNELRSLGAQIASNTTDPTHGYDCARYIVQQHPYSLGAWNCYYRVVSRLETRVSKHGKFMLATRAKYPDCVPPMIIFGHQFAMISQSQSALCEYLEAYKLQPDNPLINLCVGTSFINLALGFRINNKNQCVVQGFAFLYNYQRLCNNNQESNYNLARAYQHVGLVNLARLYYEKVLTDYQEDHPIPRLPHEGLCLHENQPEIKAYGHCDLRKEAAYNLHLIYKRSGAVDLARQILKDYCST